VVPPDASPSTATGPRKPATSPILERLRDPDASWVASGHGKNSFRGRAEKIAPKPPTPTPAASPPLPFPARPARRLIQAAAAPALPPPSPRRPPVPTARADLSAASSSAAAPRQCRRPEPGRPGGGDLRLHAPLRQAWPVPHPRGARRRGPRRPRRRRRVQRGVALPRLVLLLLLSRRRGRR
jgi:hypothetical protein